MLRFPTSSNFILDFILWNKLKEHVKISNIACVAGGLHRFPVKRLSGRHIGFWQNLPRSPPLRHFFALSQSLISQNPIWRGTASYAGQDSELYAEHTRNNRYDSKVRDKCVVLSTATGTCLLLSHLRINARLRWLVGSASASHQCAWVPFLADSSPSSSVEYSGSNWNGCIWAIFVRRLSSTLKILYQNIYLTTRPCMRATVKRHQPRMRCEPYKMASPAKYKEENGSYLKPNREKSKCIFLTFFNKSSI